MPHSLVQLGWSEFFARQLAPDERALTIGRVFAEHKHHYQVHTPTGDFPADLAGRVHHHAKGRLDYPTVGDFVILRIRVQEQKATIQRLLTRRTALLRQQDRDVQLLASNVDTAFLVTSLNENFNLRRLERYLVMVHDAGVEPVILLTKDDLVESAEAAEVIEEVRAIAGQTAIHAVSCLHRRGMEALSKYLTAGKTAVLLGSSGTGKSTLVNHLAQADIQDMMETREFDDKGRHCTTFRHLIHLPEPLGGMIIDTPGLRGLTLEPDADEGVALTFEDLDALVTKCKFTNCRHETEPQCAVKAALEGKTLDPDRLQSYLKLQRRANFSPKARRIGERD